MNIEREQDGVADGEEEIVQDDTELNELEAEDEGTSDSDTDDTDSDTESEGEGSSESASTRSASRSSSREQEAIRRAEAAERRAEAVERRLNEREQRENATLTAQQIEEKLAKMTPEERLNYRAAEAMNRITHESQKAAFINADAEDRASFRNIVAGHKNLSALSGEVENRLQDLRKQGQNVSREVMLKFVLGEKAYQAAMKGVGSRQKNAGRENINRARTQPTQARSSMNGTQRKTGDSLENRLRNVSF